jgi:hypothetical protein
MIGVPVSLEIYIFLSITKIKNNIYEHHKCIIGKSIGNSLKLIFLEQHKIKKKIFTNITKLKIIQVTDNDNTMHSRTAQNSKIEFAELVSYLITHTPYSLSICQQH